MDEQTLLHSLGAVDYARLLRRLVRHDHDYRYAYVDLQTFAQIVDDRERNRIYWFEIIERAHCASLMALRRTERWLAAMVAGASQTNFLAFGSAFRGLLESAADSRYAFDQVPEGLTSTFQIARAAVRGQVSGTVLAPNLEESLIHFSHARKIRKGEAAPESHAARTMQEYLNLLEGSSAGPMHDCYAELCNVTHPAADSVLYMLEKRDESIAFCATADEEAILELCSRGGTLATYAISESLLYPVVILKIVNQMEVAGLNTPIVNSIELSESPLWAKIGGILATMR